MGSDARNLDTDYARRMHSIEDSGRGFDSPHLHQDDEAPALAGASAFHKANPWRFARSTPLSASRRTHPGPGDSNLVQAPSQILFRASCHRLHFCHPLVTSEMNLIRHELYGWHQRMSSNVWNRAPLQGCVSIALVTSCYRCSERGRQAGKRRRTHEFRRKGFGGTSTSN